VIGEGNFITITLKVVRKRSNIITLREGVLKQSDCRHMEEGVMAILPYNFYSG